MEIKKKTHRYKYDEYSSVCVNKYECPPCSSDGIESNVHKVELMRTIVDNYNNLEANSKNFNKLTITHNGISWQLVLETTIEENNV